MHAINLKTLESTLEAYNLPRKPCLRPDGKETIKVFYFICIRICNKLENKSTLQLLPMKIEALCNNALSNAE